MWRRLMEKYPRLYEALEWGTLGLALAAFGLALYYFGRVKGWWF